jgi:hypothetical protein
LAGHFLFVDGVKAIPVLSKAETNKKYKLRQQRHHQACETPTIADHERSE